MFYSVNSFDEMYINEKFSTLRNHEAYYVKSHDLLKSAIYIPDNSNDFVAEMQITIFILHVFHQ